MSNLKKLKLIACKHVLVNETSNYFIEDFYEVTTVDFKSNIRVTHRSLPNCIISIFYALRTYQGIIAENEIYMETFEIVELKRINYTNYSKWQKRKNFR